MTRLALVLVLVPWLALSVGAKILRYAPAREASAPRAERLVRTFLESEGWAFAGRRPITGAGLYALQSFRKPGCARPLDVAVLGLSSESAEVVLANLGSDAAFLSDGRFSARASSGTFVEKAALAGLTLNSDRILAPLAVSPAPRADDRSPCAPPPPAAWARIGDEPDGG
ncbi:hypothetical protein DFR50_10650 [Roseiarcus fermentans]|uniref:Uncharacterized protein n=1 Tax=Roseiarcus fermentans TaxID=1473586 RepID=A0A366FN85_9HYPH|nr:hypothetical protein [Roseiarcus fermentans]RBP16088.1 hypothetical protein DFR50_10650 [Roseiarcus fermentans]